MHTDGIFNYKLDFKSTVAELYIFTRGKWKIARRALLTFARALNKGSEIKLELIFGELTCKFYVHN